jgi:hypothetical protein
MTVANDLKATTGAMRVEYRDGGRRIAFDGYADDRRYVSPPSDELATALIVAMDGQTTGRASVSYDDELGASKKLQVQARAWADAVTQTSRNYSDYALTAVANTEQLFSARTGAMALFTRPIGRLARWVASVTVDHDQARDELTTSSGAQILTKGDTTFIEAAGDGQLETGPVKLDAAAGVAVPIEVTGAQPWPEGKLSARYAAGGRLELEAIVARKGNVPTLRDRFQGTTANSAIGPELVTHLELRVTAHPVAGVDLLVAPYYRDSVNTLKLDPAGSGLLLNLGDMHVKGVDAAAAARLGAYAQVGGAYDYVFASSDDLGPDPLPRLPHHRGEGWVRGFFGKRVTALLRERYVGAALDSGGMTASYVLTEATVSAQLGATWLGVLRCDDLLNERPETRSGYHAPGRTISLVVQGTWD